MSKFSKPFLYIPFAHTGAQGTIALKNLTDKNRMNSDQLDCEIKDKDLTYLAKHFDNIEHYLRVFELTPAQKANVRRMVNVHDDQIAMAECLSLWRQRDPSTATLRTLLEILLSLGKGEIASNVCKYFSPTYN